ncbi:hypothetical protein [Cellulosimicrobium cellulans]|uniref:hypothetical protein n=1 Tax=Cellulosimicrobium cellulans TaxID=1710 RepID=UPI0020CC0ADB|nr:hypothetical protein NMQ07_14540 [Cellulosimicrobium cellulans]
MVLVRPAHRTGRHRLLGGGRRAGVGRSRASSSATAGAAVRVDGGYIDSIVP